MANLKLDGQYNITVMFHTMFHTYKTSFSYHNLITEKGLNFLVNKWKTDDSMDYSITKIIVGTNTQDPSPTDNISVFHNQETFNVDTSAEENRLILSNNNLNGKILNSTYEIGVIGTITEKTQTVEETLNQEEVLISRNTHPLIHIPSSSIISFEYIYTLNSSQNDEEC